SPELGSQVGVLITSRSGRRTRASVLSACVGRTSLPAITSWFSTMVSGCRLFPGKRLLAAFTSRAGDQSRFVWRGLIPLESTWALTHLRRIPRQALGPGTPFQGPFPLAQP